MNTRFVACFNVLLLGCHLACADSKGAELNVTPTASNARLQCASQRLDGEATREGLWLTSIPTNPAKDRFRVMATAIGGQSLSGEGAVSVAGQTVRFSRPGLVEEYSVSVDGVRQDFVVLGCPDFSAHPSSPVVEKADQSRLSVSHANEVGLRVELTVTGARVEPTVYGARLVLEQSGRKIAYSRLWVMDANGRQLPARIEVISNSAIPTPQSAAVLIVLVDDTDAVYPVRIDPTFSDPADDTSGPDLLHLDYQVTNQALDLKLTFAQELEGSIIDPAVHASLRLDADRSNLTGFEPGPGFHTRFGVDYEIEVFLGGFGPTSDWGMLKYWQRKLSSIPPLVELEQVQIPLGDAFEPNGSVFVVGANATYGTDNHQIFLRVPLNLFTNVSFPICGEGTVCINDLFPCPLPVTQNLETAFLSVFAMDPYDLTGMADFLPDAGMMDCASGVVVNQFAFDDTDLVASATDPADDGLAQPGNNGEELTGLKVFQHAGGVLSFELKLESYSFEDTAAYYLALDLDNNLATGEPWTNGTGALGVDLMARFANFDNPIGWANPLEGTIYFRVGGQWCPLNYADYLATVWRSTPGYVYITLPAEFTQPMLATNTTGFARAVAMTEDPPSGDFNDLVPNDGSLLFAVDVAPRLVLTALTPQPDGTLLLRFTWNRPTAATFSVLKASDLNNTWLPEPGAVITELGGGAWQVRLTPATGQEVGFYRVLAVQ